MSSQKPELNKGGLRDAMLDAVAYVDESAKEAIETIKHGNFFRVTMDFVGSDVVEVDATMSQQDIAPALASVRKERNRATAKGANNNPNNLMFKRFVCVPINVGWVGDNTRQIAGGYEGVFETYSDAMPSAVMKTISGVFQRLGNDLLSGKEWVKGMRAELATCGEMKEMIGKATDAPADLRPLYISGGECGNAGFDYDKFFNDIRFCRIHPTKASHILPPTTPPKLMGLYRAAVEMYNEKIMGMPLPENRITIIVCPSDRLAKLKKTGGTGKSSLCSWYQSDKMHISPYDVFKAAAGKNRLDGLNGQKAVYIGDWQQNSRVDYPTFLELSDPHPRHATEVDARYHNGIARHDLFMIDTNLTATDFLKTLIFRMCYTAHDEYQRAGKESLYGCQGADDYNQIRRRIKAFYIIDVPNELCDENGDVMLGEIMTKDGRVNPQKLIANRWHWRMNVTGDNDLYTAEFYQTENDKTHTLFGKDYCKEFREEESTEEEDDY